MGWLKGRRLWLLASLVLLATLISNLPAQLVWRQVQPHLPVKVELDGLTGTLWRGSLARLQVDGIDQGAVGWRWQPAGMLAGKVTEGGWRIAWQDAGGGLPSPLALGNLAADLAAENGWLVMSLADNGGPLGLAGTARWQPAKPLKLDTRLLARADADRDLAAGLQLLGRADPDGWVRWRVQLQ